MNHDLLTLKAYDYPLPKELIAQFPTDKRSQSRLLHVKRSNGQLVHTKFSEIEHLLKEGDLLVVNSSKVFPARLYGRKSNGTTMEILLLHQVDEGRWQCLASPGKRLKQAQELQFSANLKGFISQGDSEGLREISFSCQGSLWDEINRIGHIPLPPYIERQDGNLDSERYQTVYAREIGSVAAPTAGLHFDLDLLSRLEQKGVELKEVILHVGIGTFRPVKTPVITDHAMHQELATIPEDTARAINQAKADGRRIICVGTTSVRSLESFYCEGRLLSGSKWTDIFIYPGFQFQITDALITNFHLPQSTLLMMISAFAGYDLIRQAYSEAIENRYRFFSYGDAMFIED
ncbi:tRNA preQ1(34) S-adenosylmethionine ribosyltransferase-isomerase QueA [Candidatus Cloacimonadaceae bacterium]